MESKDINTSDILNPEESNKKQQTQNQDDLWNYHNMVQAVAPSRKQRTGTNLSPANKLKAKKKKARKVQRNSRKTNRK